MAGASAGGLPSVATGTDGVWVCTPIPRPDGPSARSATANVRTPSKVPTATYGVATPAALLRCTNVGLASGLALMSPVVVTAPKADVGDEALPIGTLNSLLLTPS